MANEEKQKKTPGLAKHDSASQETAIVYVPVNRLAKVDAIDINTPIANRVLNHDKALAPTTKHTKDDTVVMTSVMGQKKDATSRTNETIATSVLRRLHGSDSDDLFAAALKSKQTSLINSDNPRFTMIGKLGEGSQGIVYRVNDRDTHREVACKVLSYATTDPEEISRFIHEAQVTAQLEHPGIVPIHDLGELRDGTVYYTMKRIDGKSLDDILVANKHQLERRFELMQIFIRICETVAFAHSRGVVHRDLKPRNIMVGQFGEVLVVDWGLAKVVNCPDVARPMASMRTFPEADAYRTLNGTAVGTPAYMSPEQAMGEVDTLDRRCDIYSLGVILYEILCGESPYVRGEARKVMHQVSHGMWTKLDQRPAGAKLPRALIAIVHRAMAFERNDRYSLVDDFAADLRTYLAGGAVSAYSETTVEKIGRYISHHRRQVRAIAITAMCAVTIVLGIIFSQWYEEEQIINKLRIDLQASLELNKFSDAKKISDAILNLRPDDRNIMRLIPRIENGLKQLEAQQFAEKKDSEAKRLILEAGDLAAFNTIESLQKASEKYMQAIGLVPNDESVANLYRQAINSLAQLQQKKADDDKKDRKIKAGIGLMNDALKSLAFVQPLKLELIAFQKEHRYLAGLIRNVDDPNMRLHLHELENAIEDKKKSIGLAEGRVALLLDKAQLNAPDNQEVSSAFAEYFYNRFLYFESKGDIINATDAEARVRKFDANKLEYNERLQGLARVKAKNKQSLTLQLLEEGIDRTLSPAAGDAGKKITVPVDTELIVERGRYLLQNEHGDITALHIKRGDSLLLEFPVHAPLPPGVAFILGGKIADAEGLPFDDVKSFGLCTHEITCGEWLTFLNDPETLATINAAERAGSTILVPRLNNQPLWERNMDGIYQFPAHETTDGIFSSTWPITCISGRDAMAYARWRSKRDKLPWRLPTNGEWLLAAQSGDGRLYSWGMRADLSFSATTQDQLSERWCQIPVGSYLRDQTVHGVFDLCGSVAEFVLDVGVVRQAAGGCHKDRLTENFTVYSRHDVQDTDTKTGIGLRLALTLKSDQ